MAVGQNGDFATQASRVPAVTTTPTDVPVTSAGLQVLPCVAQRLAGR